MRTGERGAEDRQSQCPRVAGRYRPARQARRKDHREPLTKELHREFRELLVAIADLEARIGEVEEDASRGTGFYSAQDIGELITLVVRLREQAEEGTVPTS